jgi:hypothetical protein
MRMHWIVLEISILLFGLARRNKRISTPPMPMICYWYDHRFLIVFSSRWSWIVACREILRMQISDIMLLQLYEEHNSVIKKIWRR